MVVGLVGAVSEPPQALGDEFSTFKLRNKPPVYNICKTFRNLNADWIIVDIKDY